MKYIGHCFATRTNICTLIFLSMKSKIMCANGMEKKNSRKKKIKIAHTIKKNERKRARALTNTHLKCAQGHKNIIRFNCWWHFFSLLFYVCHALFNKRFCDSVLNLCVLYVYSYNAHTLARLSSSSFMFIIPLT